MQFVEHAGHVASATSLQGPVKVHLAHTILIKFGAVMYDAPAAGDGFVVDR